MNSHKTLKDNMQRLKNIRAFENNAALARKINVSSRTINLIFDEHSGNPTLSTLESIAKALKIPIWSLLYKDFPFYNKDQLSTISELISTFDTMPNSDLKDILDYARIRSSHNKIKEKLATYEPNNPLLKY